MAYTYGLKEEQRKNDRIAVCDGCEHLSDLIYRKCKFCLCPVAVKATADENSCPENKWAE